YPFLRGDSCETDCQQMQIWQLETLSLQMLIFVCPDVEALNQHNTYFSHVALLVLFGRQFGLGLACRRWTLRIYLITLFNSFALKVAFELVGPSCNSSG
ncbi:hypothetical protein A2U01_0049647, partial [Trifolium medium]|nr:hypothetical protein [Trifolium medium]